MLKKSIFISTICALALSSNLNAKEFSLQELIDIAVSNNANIEVSKNQEKVKEQELKKAKSAYLPKLTASADTGYYDIEAGNQDGNASSFTVGASQLLYDFGKTSSSIDASKHNLDASSKDIDVSKQSTILQIKQAYYDILNNYQQILVSKESVKLDDLQLSQAKEYFKAGIRTQIDITNAQLQLSNSKLKLVQNEYSLKNANAKLISILGKALNTNIEVKEPKYDIKNLAKKASLKYKSLDELIQIGLTSRPEIKKYEALIKTNKASLENANSQYYPTLDVSASYNDKTSDDIASLDSDQTAVLLNLKWNLYTGGTRDADKKIALTNLNTTHKQMQQQKLEITQDITSAYYDTKQSFDSIKIGLLSLNLATKNLDLATQRYKAGLNDLLEVNDAKLEYTQSKSTLVNTYYTYLTSIANLEYSLGVTNDK